MVQLAAAIFARQVSKLSSRPIALSQLFCACSWLTQLSMVVALPQFELWVQMAVYNSLHPATAGAVSAKPVGPHPAGMELQLAAARDVAQLAAVASELQAMP